MIVEGQYLAAGSTRTEAATLGRDGDHLVLRHGGHERRLDSDQFRVSDRLASLPRRLEFPAGDSFSTPDNDGIDTLLADLGLLREPSLVDRLERRWVWALAAVAALPVCLWLLFSYGLPLVADPLSRAVPEAVTDELDDAILELLENQVFEPTTLTPERQAEITALLDALEPEPAVDLLFYAGGAIDANALALPGGTIVLTDELVFLSEYDGELSAVLAHEVAHVHHRHALRALIQTVGAATVLSWIFGDLTLATDLVLVSAPALLQQLSYTRAFEREADAEARRQLQAHGIPERCLASLMERLEAHVGGDTERVPGFLQTHPGFRERIAAAQDGPPCGP